MKDLEVLASLIKERQTKSDSELSFSEMVCDDFIEP